MSGIQDFLNAESREMQEVLASHLWQMSAQEAVRTQPGLCEEHLLDK